MKEPPPLRANVVITVGNCGLYLGGFGVRVEDTVLVAAQGHNVPDNVPAKPLLARRNSPPNGASIRVDGVAGAASESQVTC
jgi:hypothetical protein